MSIVLVALEECQRELYLKCGVVDPEIRELLVLECESLGSNGLHGPASGRGHKLRVGVVWSRHGSCVVNRAQSLFSLEEHG
eukprot:16436227-Heterocapsa_arctica.AAC.1